MSRSKRTQEEIQNKKADQYDYIGDKKVAEKLHEIEFAPSALRVPHGLHDADPRWTIERSPWDVPIGEIHRLAQSTLDPNDPHKL